LEKKSILIVDDDETVLKSIEEILTLEGYSADIAKTGKEAIEKSKFKSYNLVLIDIRLPDMEGTKLLTALRDTTPGMVKIIITGYPSLENAAEAVNEDADGYLVKPAKMDDLLNMVKDRLKKQEGEERYSEQKVKEFIETRAREYAAKASEKG
jgi:two-component system nitrogen regulation response regulator NtrX